MRRNRYIKFAFPFDFIKQIACSQNKRKLIFFIDLLSISKGLYNKDNVFMELKTYIETRKPSETLVDEYRQFLNRLYVEFKQFNPFFVTFYDDGKNIQNTSISSSYKGGRASSEMFGSNDEYELYKDIKKLYMIKIEERCNVEGFGKVYYLKEYESDLIPYYCITNELYESAMSDVLNVVISVDKDLLQCCQFTNTIQVTNRFMPSKVGNKRLNIKVYDDKNAIEYIYPKFKSGILTAKHIPLIFQK